VKKVIILAMLLSVMLIGCSDSSNNDPRKPNIKENKVATKELTDNYQIESKTEETPTGEETSTLIYPVVSGLDKNVQDKVNEWIEFKISAYRNLINEMKDLGEPQEVWYEATYKSKEILSIKLYSESDMVDFKDVLIDSLNFDLKYGNPYELKDVMKSGFENKLTPIMAEKIKEKNVQLKEEFKGGDASRGFYFTDNALVVYYQYPAYVDITFGPLEIEIPYDEIKDILKDGIVVGK
jgi:hypothetical protein